MFDFIRSLFGKGQLVYDVVLTDGREARLKCAYTGSLDTLDHEAVMRKAQLSGNFEIASWTYLGDI